MRDGEQPRAEPGVGVEPFRVLCEAQERLLKQILGRFAPAGHAHEISVDPAAIRGEHGIERTGFAPAETCDPISLDCQRLQRRYNASPAYA